MRLDCGESSSSIRPLVFMANTAVTSAPSSKIESGVEAAEKIMHLPQAPTAIFAVNDNTAIGALSGLMRMGLSVRGDVSLVGYNDIPIVGHLSTSLTTLRVPFEQIAENALDLLGGEAIPPDDRIRVSAQTLIPRKSKRSIVL